MTKKQKVRLIEALKIRMKQFEAKMFDKPLKYELRDGHHMRDLATTIAVLEEHDNADNLLERMPTEKDLIGQANKKRGDKMIKLTKNQSKEFYNLNEGSGTIIITLSNNEICIADIHLGRDGYWYQGTRLLGEFLEEKAREIT